MSGRQAISCRCLLSLGLLFGLTLTGQADHRSSNSNRVADTKPKAFYTPQPEYTDSARNDRVEGAVFLAVKVEADGHPNSMKVLKSLRSDLDEKAKEAVSKWLFRPAVKDSKDIPFIVSVKVDFHLPPRK